jgi:hypothetical protein
MGMTLWLHVLHDRTIESGETDYSSLWQFTEELDALCTRLGILVFSGFFDHTDMKYNLADGPEDAETDPETGWAYGIDDMDWFDTKDGLGTLQALETHLAGDPESLQMKPSQLEALLEELREVCTKLESAGAGTRFHLELVM